MIFSENFYEFLIHENTKYFLKVIVIVKVSEFVDGACQESCDSQKIEEDFYGIIWQSSETFFDSILKIWFLDLKEENDFY